MNLYPYVCDDGSYFISAFAVTELGVVQLGAMGFVDLEALKEFTVLLGEYISEEEARLSKFKVPDVYYREMDKEVS